MSGSPSETRNLPEDYYGHFDIRQTPDGGKRYRLPHTLHGTVTTLATSFRTIAVVAVATTLTVMIQGRPVEPPWLDNTIAFLGVHALVTVAILLWALVTGYRCSTFITIRADGLVWNDRAFFPARHIWSISYGTTFNQGKSDETFVPLIEIQVGTKTVLLAEHLDPVAGKMFMRLFSNDTRRYWHGHN